MKYVIVTGAYGGMGKETVNALTKQGYTVFALDLKVEQPTQNIIPIQVDITNENSVKNAFEIVKQTTSSIFAIIHYAGIYKLDSLVEMNFEEFDNIFKINVHGAFLINKTFLPLLCVGSRIVITTSELAPLNPLPFTGIYAITKSALDKYAHSLKMELQLLGIHVSVLRAGAVKTNMLGVSTDQLDKFCEKTKLYKCNASRFKKIVNNVESKCIDPKILAKKMLKIINHKKPKMVYTINRNKLLKFFNILPKKLQFFAIKKVLK